MQNSNTSIATDSDLLAACEAGHETGCANQLDTHLGPEHALLTGLEVKVTEAIEVMGWDATDPDVWDAAAIGYLASQASPAARRALVSLIARELGIKVS